MGGDQTLEAYAVGYNPVALHDTLVHPVSISNIERNEISNHAEKVEIGTINSTVGRWRDGIFNFFNNISPSLLMACFCEPCLLGQIAERLTQLGEERILSTLTIKWFNIPQFGALNTLGPFYSILIIYIVLIFISAFYGIYVVMVVPQTYLFVVAFYLRRIIRERDNIQGQVMKDCLFTWFSCLRPFTSAHMARHIIGYKFRCDAIHLSSNGMPDNRIFLQP
eukprot:gene1355-2620_t